MSHNVVNLVITKYWSLINIFNENFKTIIVCKRVVSCGASKWPVTDRGVIAPEGVIISKECICRGQETPIKSKVLLLVSVIPLGAFINWVGWKRIRKLFILGLQYSKTFALKSPTITTLSVGSSSPRSNDSPIKVHVLLKLDEGV